MRGSLEANRGSALSRQSYQDALEEARSGSQRLRSRTRSSTAEQVEAMPFARELGLWPEMDWDMQTELVEPKVGEVPIRRLSCAIMQWLQAQGVLMEGWEKFPHIFLDFSSELFRLQTMHPTDFRYRRKETEKTGPRLQRTQSKSEEEIIVGKLVTLKADNNELRDSDFDPAKDAGISGSAFTSLRTLTLSKNLLVYPIFMLPRLKVLDLSQNRLVNVPPLTGLAALETLLLSQNLIEDLEAKSFKEKKAANLKVLDLRANRLDVRPKQLRLVFDELARSSQVTTLRLAENPFCCVFPEYHMLAVLCMPRLRLLDRVALTAETLEELHRYGQSYFGMQLKNHVSSDGQLLELVNSISSFPDDSNKEPLPEVNHFLQLRLGVEVSSLEEARVFFLQDRTEDLEGEIKDREKIADHGGLGVGISRRTIQRNRLVNADQEVPLLSSMIQELDSAIAGHTIITNSTSIVFQKATQLASLPPDRAEDAFNDVKVKTNMKTGKMDPNLLRMARDDLARTFAEQVSMLAERYPSLRSILIRTLAKCGSIANELSPPCLQSMALLARADDETRRAVLEVVQEIILPVMQEGQILEESIGQLYQAVANMAWDNMEGFLLPAVVEISAAAKSILRSAENSKVLAKMQRSCEAAMRLLEIAVRDEAAAARVIKEDVLRAIGDYLAMDTVFLDRSACWIYVSGINVVLGCLEHHREKALASLASAGLHVKLLQNMEELLKSKETPGPALNRKAGSSMELLASLVQEDEILQELLQRNGEENPFVRVSLAPLQLPLADPVQLGGGLRCLCALLYNDLQRGRFGSIIVSNLQLLDKKKNKIWGYIDGTHFKEISRSCEMYSKHEENAKDPSRGFGTSDLIDFVGVTDPGRIRNVFMQKMLVRVIEFLTAFSALATGEAKELCTKVSQVFNELGRESVLFQLLQVPSEEVQETVMACLQYARLEELDDEEVQQLLHMLDPDIVESGERLLGALLRNLMQFLEKDGEAADKFRRNHTRSVIERTFRVLATNSARETFGNPAEEEQKITLSEQCVQVLMSASSQPLLRRHLRGEVAKEFLRMLKDHETLDPWSGRDVNLELTWTGRHLDLLLSCLNTASPMCLRNDMKQAFRVMHRIANVMAGVSDGVPRTAEERGQEETAMWDETLMAEEASRLDEVASEDRRQQQLIFFSFSGIERMVHFLEMPPEDGLDHSVDRKSDRSVAVELHQEARAYLEELLREVRSSHEALKRRKAAAAHREEPESVEVEDIQLADTRLKGYDLLREVFAKQGWMRARREKSEAMTEAHSQSSRLASLLRDLFQRAQQSAPVELHLSSAKAPKRLQRRNSFFVEGGLVESCFFVASVLRTIFSALTLPTTEEVSSTVKVRLRNPAMQLRLVALLERCGYMDCHLAAKLMRILSMVLRLPGESSLHPEENEWQHCVGLVIAAGLAGRVFDLLEPLLKHLGQGFDLESAQLILAREAVRLLNTVASMVSRLHFESNPEIQKEALETMLLDLIPMPTTKAVVLLLLYAGRDSERQELHDLCSDTLARMIHMASSVRYEVLEVMNRRKILDKKFKSSLISDLLDRAEALRLRQLRSEQEMEEPSLLEAATSHVSAALDGAMAQFKAIFQEKLDSQAV